MKANTKSSKKQLFSKEEIAQDAKDLKEFKDQYMGQENVFNEGASARQLKRLLNGKEIKHSRYGSNVSIKGEDLSSLEQTKYQIQKLKASEVTQTAQTPFQSTTAYSGHINKNRIKDQAGIN